MVNGNIYKISIFDYVIAGVFGLIAVVLTYSLYITTFNSNFDGKKLAQVYQKDKLLYALDMQKPGLTKFDGMVIETKDNRVRVLESDCPRNVCVSEGWISEPYQRIICIPKKVVIEVSGEPSGQENKKYDYSVR